MSERLRPLIGRAAEGPLSREQAESAFSAIMDGDATPAQIGGFLMALRTRGESVAEYAAAAAVMRAKCLRVRAPEGAIDIVGTGGDGRGTLNISTAAALVVAGAGVLVAKHGNRNLSSKSGAADILTELGVNVMVGPEVVERALAEVGIGFMMAPMHHPAVRHVMPARQELGTRTIFNILGPLTNPAAVRRQLTGAFSRAVIRPMAETLGALGADRAWVVHGADGTDEVSIAGETFVAELAEGRVREFSVHPEDAGLAPRPLEAILGGAPAENARALRGLLAGEASAYRDAVLLNAAAALVVAERVADLARGGGGGCRQHRFGRGAGQGGAAGGASPRPRRPPERRREHPRGDQGLQARRGRRAQGGEAGGGDRGGGARRRGGAAVRRGAAQGGRRGRLRADRRDQEGEPVEGADPRRLRPRRARRRLRQGRRGLPQRADRRAEFSGRRQPPGAGARRDRAAGFAQGLPLRPLAGGGIAGARGGLRADHPGGRQRRRGGGARGGGRTPGAWTC